MNLNVLYRVAKIFWPELEQLNDQRRMIGTGNVFFFLYTLPLAVLTIFLLIRTTDLGVFSANTSFLLIFALVVFLFTRINFFTIVEIHPGTFANAESSLSGVILWSGLLLIGPEILWLPLVGKFFEIAWKYLQAQTIDSRWVHARSLTLYTAAMGLSSLAGLYVYRLFGGVIPLEGLGSSQILSALAAIATHVVIFVLIYSGFILYIAWAQGEIASVKSRRRVIAFFILALGMPFLGYPFGILAAGLYSQNNLFSYLFFILGLALVSIMARQLSRYVENSRQQHRQLEQLEILSRDIIISTPDASELPEFLQSHIPIMFPSARIIIWVEPDNFLLRHPKDWSPEVVEFWEWVKHVDYSEAFETDGPLPWRNVQSSHNPILASPVLEVETQRTIGFIYIELQNLVQPWNRAALLNLFPGLNALAAQIASALKQANVYKEALDMQRTAQELDFASEIQASFFPDVIPTFPGWDLAVTILPAREMAGDFFDLIPLENGKLGILIADVTDKGVGPALYMALSRTLIRTYAIEYEFEPDTIFFAANRRILQDARARLFVTAFYGVLDPESGTLIYSNAGHNPPFLIRNDHSGRVDSLNVTGMPIGMEKEAVWEQHEVKLDCGDVLVLYTDGIPDALNKEGEFYEEESLIDVASGNAKATAHEVQAAIIDRLQNFVGEAQQVDDITLMVLKRQESKPNQKTEEK